MADLTITLSFHEDEVSRRYPNGYWYAAAKADDSVEYDATSVTPLGAVTLLAQELYAAVKEQ